MKEDKSRKIANRGIKNRKDRMKEIRKEKRKQIREKIKQEKA